MYRAKTDGCVIRLSDGASIPPDERNRDWRKYLAWQAGGNTPQPAEPEPIPPPPEPTVRELFEALAAKDKGDSTQWQEIARRLDISL